ncbi:MAG: hypothetical protein AAFU64_09955 [Bacteroidota bacterium]
MPRLLKAIVFLSLVPLLLFTSCDETLIDVITEKGKPKNGALYDLRYCEVLTTEINSSGISLLAYNTIGCSECPDEAWSALNADTLEAELGSPFIRLNGPRHWVLDSIASNTISTDCDTAFGDIPMSFVAAIPVTSDVLGAAQSGYQPSLVARNTAYFYFKDKPVYILESPLGDCYMMQSYSQNIDPGLQLEDLVTLGRRLNLPPGWSFKTRVLEDDFVLESQDGFAELISDDLENAYQLLNEGCL